MRKGTLVFIFAITALMFYTGCGEDDDVGAGRPAAPGAPAAMSPECEECPCKFFDVPMNDGCWPSPLFVLNIPSDYFTCRLVDTEGGADLFTEAPGPLDTSSQLACSISTGNDQVPGCDVMEVRHVFTNEERNNNVTFSCRTCMNQYINDLINTAMIPVTFPEESECRPPF